MNFALAQKIADAVLFEGYVLYPYRASATKNQVRWQFGIVAPRGYSESGGSEPWAMQTECLVEPDGNARLTLRIRFLQVQARIVEEVVDLQADLFRPVETLEVDGQQRVTWDEGIECALDQLDIDLNEILATERIIPFDIPGRRAIEFVQNSVLEITGRIVRERWPISGVIRVAAQALGSVVKVRVRIENLSTWPGATDADRDHALRRSLISAHTLLAVRGGLFVSLLDPPEWARPAVEICVNLCTWPVLLGENGQRDLMLSSPIILYDYPAIAPESPGDLFDATEIDEILTLRTMTLTETEKQEARATDERAAALINRIDTMPPEILDRLHGALRYVRETTRQVREEPEPVPWWDPGADALVSPETDHVQIGGVCVVKGSRVRLCPGQRRADAQDMFLVGRTATVEAIFFDVEDHSYLAVTLADDPAAEFHQSHGRFLYFSPDEVEPLDTEGSSSSAIQSQES